MGLWICITGDPAVAVSCCTWHAHKWSIQPQETPTKWLPVPYSVVYNDPHISPIQRGWSRVEGLSYDLQLSENWIVFFGPLQALWEQSSFPTWAKYGKLNKFTLSPTHQCNFMLKSTGSVNTATSWQIDGLLFLHSHLNPNKDKILFFALYLVCFIRLKRAKEAFYSC